MKKYIGAVVLSVVGVSVAFLLTIILYKWYGIAFAGIVMLFYFSCIQKQFSENIFLFVIPVTSFIAICFFNYLFPITTGANVKELTPILSITGVQIFISGLICLVLYSSRYFNLCTFFKNLKK